MSDFRKIEDELERAFEAAGFEVLHASREAYLVSIPHRCKDPGRRDGCDARANSRGRIVCDRCDVNWGIGDVETISLSDLARRLAG